MFRDQTRVSPSVRLVHSGVYFSYLVNDLSGVAGRPDDTRHLTVTPPGPSSVGGGARRRARPEPKWVRAGTAWTMEGMPRAPGASPVGRRGAPLLH